MNTFTQNLRTQNWFNYIYTFIFLVLIQVLSISFITEKSWTVSISILIGLIMLYLVWKMVKSFVSFHMVYQELMEEEKRLSTLLHSLPDFVCFKDGKGRWLKINEFGCELYQLKDISYAGKTDIELGELNPFFKEAYDYCIISDERTWKSRKLSRGEESFFIPSGELKTFDVIKVPLFYPNGERKGLVTIGRDITQQKVAEDMLIKTEKLSVVGELAAGIAHEIRNPLTSIKGFIQLLEENDDVPASYLDVMSSEMDRINQIVSDLLILAKPESKAYKPLNICEIMGYVKNVMSHEALLKGINLVVGDQSKEKKIFGDKNQLIQVLINVIKNAIDAMKTGEINIMITNKNNQLKITIQDQGIGIPPDRLKKLGEPFFTLKEKGMGLGLTISQKIIQDHKGSLEIESEVGIGTSVHVILPVYKKDNEEGFKASSSS
jgi:two-component system, sporulation sensor kinase A